MSNIQIRQGDTWRRTATFTFAVGNLVGAKLWMTIKRSASLSDAEADLQVDSAGSGGIEILDASSARFTLTPTQTAALSARDYKFDVQVLLSTGEIYTTDSGTASVLAQITQATS